MSLSPKPECLECGASFIEKDDGAFLHCSSTRHISIERHPRPAIPPARVVAHVYFDAREPLRYGRNYLWGRGECHGEAYDTETVDAKCRRRSVCDANECGGDLRRRSPSRGLNWPVAARPALRLAILAHEAAALALFAKLCSKDLVAVVFEIASIRAAATRRW
jgi:hypothetical protein